MSCIEHMAKRNGIRFGDKFVSIDEIIQDIEPGLKPDDSCSKNSRYKELYTKISQIVDQINSRVTDYQISQKIDKIVKQKLKKQKSGRHQRYNCIDPYEYCLDMDPYGYLADDSGNEEDDTFNSIQNDISLLNSFVALQKIQTKLNQQEKAKVPKENTPNVPKAPSVETAKVVISSDLLYHENEKKEVRIPQNFNISNPKSVPVPSIRTTSSTQTSQVQPSPILTSSISNFQLNSDFKEPIEYKSSIA